MKKEYMQIRIDEKIKKEYKNVCDKKGTTVSDDIRRYITSEANKNKKG